jgi:Fic family protein
MRWNWQQPDWPDFRWDEKTFVKAEAAFLRGAGVLVGSAKHLDENARQQLLVDAMSVEALTTSEIEGEILNRASVQSSIQRQLGFLSDRRKVQPAEQGISELMVDLYRGVDGALTEDQLFSWHRMVVSGRADLRDIGRYRTNDEPMQVVSGVSYAPKVHFEAPPSPRVRKEMGRFLEWFNGTGPGTNSALPALTRGGIAHLYFESIHPFEDGILSTVYYPELSRTMAMKLGGEYSSEKVWPHNFEQLAEDAGLAKPLVMRRVAEMIDEIRAVLPQMHSDEITSPIATRILERCELSQRRFQR